MLGQSDFIAMLGELRKQLADNIGKVESVSEDVFAEEILYRLASLSQSKRKQISVLNAIVTLVKNVR